MLKNKNGVTLVVLILSVIIMLIIFGVTVTSGTDLLENADKNRLKSNLYLVKARAETLLEDYLFDGTDNLGDEASSSQISGVGFDESSEEYIYRVWDTSKLEEEGISTDDVKTAEVFVIQYDIENDSVDVASTVGTKNDDGSKVYILSEID